MNLNGIGIGDGDLVAKREVVRARPTATRDTLTPYRTRQRIPRPGNLEPPTGINR